MVKRLECAISGRVQMVMFRDFTRRAALALGLTGTVQNMLDGTVLVVAEGEETQLRALLGELHKGSTFSKVEKVTEQWGEPTGEFISFNITYRSVWDRI